MIWLELLLFIVVIAVGCLGYYLGYTKGAALGFLDGWILATRPRGPQPGTGHVRVVEPLYDWVKEGL